LELLFKALANLRSITFIILSTIETVNIWPRAIDFKYKLFFKMVSIVIYLEKILKNVNIIFLML